ncbi:MAG: 4-(cytidine 5'-diphospho)-2-C-methyl-D-erythritol kinase [Bacteroidales bacterium]|nr:4-(cytidine 5'-diphospho)-2-C-methyl-D-erythritol kinase [Bacteroidales bacterium]
MICFPNCKINLGLSVINKRTDGFHNIETILYPVQLFDALEIIKASDNKFSFQTSGLTIKGNIDNNLCLKAYEILTADFDLPPVKIHLHKNIPIGAGLGGGSADAAFMIKLLNDLFKLFLSSDKMKYYARQLGSDCVFFIDNKAVFAFEKGDLFEQINLNLNNYFIAIVKPEIHINTSKAYSGIKPVKKEKSIKEIIELPVNEWKFNLFNDFEEPIFKTHPEIKNIKEKLYDSGAVYAAMSGSGSAVFGIFENHINIKETFQNCFIWQGELFRCSF